MVSPLVCPPMPYWLLKIEKMTGDTFRYTYVTVDSEDLNFPKKMYRLPVPQAELNTNKDIEQFAEWK